MQKNLKILKFIDLYVFLKVLNSQVIVVYSTYIIYYIYGI